MLLKGTHVLVFGVWQQPFFYFRLQFGVKEFNFSHGINILRAFSRV